jgi:type I restriction enzyme S subunit
VSGATSTAKLGDLGDLYGGLSGKTKSDFGAGSARYITFMNVMANPVLDAAKFELVRVGPRERQNRALRGDIFFNASSETPEEVGMCALLDSELPDLYLNSFCMGFRLHPGVDVEALYLVYFLRGGEGRRLFSSLAQGSTRYNISKRAVRELLVPLPSRSRQREIVEFLLDADRAVAAADAAMAKRRNLRDGLADGLLSSRIRLPGFTKPWTSARLEQLCRPAIGRTPSREIARFWGRGTPWMTIGDMKAKHIRSTREQVTEAGARDLALIEPGTLLMSFKLSIGRTGFAGVPLFTNEAVCALRDLRGDPDYLYYQLPRTDFSLYGKLAVKGYTLNSASLRSIVVPTPELDEQRAIGATLSDLDRDLELLGEKRAKLGDLREAIARRLLAGLASEVGTDAVAA